MLDKLQFTIPEMLSLMGLVQCIYILVYMGLRAGEVRRAVLPFLYFLVLGSAFFFDFASRFIAELTPHYHLILWAAWFAGPPLSVLLIIQIAHIRETPSWRHFWVLLLIPAALTIAWLCAYKLDDECTALRNCPPLREWLVVCGLLAGLCSMAAIWFQRHALQAMAREKGPTAERYWLALMLILANLSFLGLMLLSLTPGVDGGELSLIRTFLGLGFVYLAGTSLFRIYPQALHIRQAAPAAAPLSSSDQGLASKLEKLFTLDKVYQEPTYGRAQLARELNVPEATVSKVINQHFGKSLPQLLNEYRIEDAKRLLLETEAPINVIAGDVGFNSLASFNRVFRDMTGTTPGAFRMSARRTD